jgi:hypothetical protein
MQKLLSPRIPAIAVLFTIAFFLTTIFPREIFFEVEKKCKEVPCDSSITCPSISTARSPPAVTIQEPCHSIDLKTAFSGVVDFDPLHAGYWQAQQGQDKVCYPRDGTKCLKTAANFKFKFLAMNLWVSNRTRRVKYLREAYSFM